MVSTGRGRVLGWLDTPAPTGVVWGTLLLIGALLVPALIAARPRMRWALVAAIVAAVVIPVLAQAVLYPTTGLIWQGRYTLVLSIGVVITAGIALDDSQELSPRLARRLLGTCLVLGQASGR